MKILFGIVLIALSLIVKPVLAEKAKASIYFTNESTSFAPVNIVKINSYCMTQYGLNSIQVALHTTTTVDIEEPNLSPIECQIFKWREINWKVNPGIYAAPDSPGACNMNLKYGYYFLKGWWWTIESNCPITATCTQATANREQENCLNKEVWFGNENNASVKIVFDFDRP
ncbi:hypothetical protein [Xenorhabdus bharatensis]|uniref:hypothetical protein n=1 Tax=Xenorhabdus bharatensis TaxID=3136256 RepID=UPI0030F3B67B